MIVLERKWISESAEEAILIIRDGDQECAAFSHPCKLSVGGLIIRPLLAINIKNFIRVDNQTKLEILKQSDGFSHVITALVEDCDRNIVSVGGIKIEVDDYIPKDISPGDKVNFYCSRLDVL
ncbi:hypothetical protein QM999_09740 [Pectobacterium cacticida]|uniref:hypothetical protein n=1 Tax=Pectobacterium cacticida TaxID=69221 RepID=UPI002FF28493